MAYSISGGISIQGLGSGTDFASIIEKLKEVESIPMYRLKVWRAEWMTRVDAFKEILNGMQEAKSALQAFSSMDKMLQRTVDSSMSTVATATADSNIDEGIYTIDVQQLASASVFSNKKVFDSKQEAVTTDGAKTFAYTYKGVRRELTVANNTTLENLVDQINKDADNPGVRASLIKTGSGYVFQMQGKDTGKGASLSIESNLDGFDSTPLFSGRDVVLNNSSEDQNYTYEYGGKTYSLSITAGMTAEQFVKEFNKQKSGVTASLELKGSNYVLQMRDSDTKNVVNLPARTDCEALGGGGFAADFDPGRTLINTTGEVQTFSYAYKGKTYSVNVGVNFTMNDLVDKINSSSSKPKGLTASFDASSGRIAFTTTDAVLTSEDAQFRFYGLNLGENLADEDIPSLSVPAGTTLSGFVSLFNKSAYSTEHGYSASLEDDGSGGQNLVIKDADGQPINLYNANDPGIDGSTRGIAIETTIAGLIPADGGSASFNFGPQSIELSTASVLPGLGGRPELDGRNVVVNSTGAGATFSFTDPRGTTRTLDVADGATMQDFVDAFNAKFRDDPDTKIGIEARVVAMGSGYEIQYFTQGAEGEERISLASIDSGDMKALRDNGDNWYSKQAEDAMFTMNGWPQALTSESNTLTEVIEGLNITLKSTGETTLSVANDKETLKENIRSVVDTINGLRSMIKELTKVDTSKEVKSPEVDESSGLLTLQSQFTWQYGSTLTGNYGVQLLASRLKSLTADSADGFKGRSSQNDILGDLFTNWAQIGIGTVTDESDPENGLLRIDEDALDAAIEKDIRNVAELFSANSEASTNTSDFSVASVGTRAKAGTYDVTYEVKEYTDPETGVTSTRVTNVYINGVKAEEDSAYPGRFTVGDYDNDAAGLAIQFTEADLVPGNHSGTVRIKQGKVGEMIDLLAAECQPVVEGSKQTAGTIPLLIDNYSNSKTGIVAGIDKKIEREVSRLAQWESRQKALYSRLDTLLSQMNSTMEANEAALSQLNSKK
ncbi:MAG: flagellar filament capping protein FliD [Desulfovibrionaceae bacterium]|nr:flagellar filament capping protein FliD [Desulfovibrionaceae bacterium]